MLECQIKQDISTLLLRVHSHTKMPSIHFSPQYFENPSLVSTAALMNAHTGLWRTVLSLKKPTLVFLFLNFMLCICLPLRGEWLGKPEGKKMPLVELPSKNIWISHLEYLFQTHLSYIQQGRIIVFELCKEQ